MPSGPESFVSHPQYAREFDRARELLLTHPGRWRIIYHYDGDGIAGASSAVRALGRLGYPAQATPLLGVERGKIEELLHATPGPVWVIDTGASWLDAFAKHAHPVIVLDHHKAPPFPGELPAHVAYVNPLNWGVDGMSELCGATLTWLFTIFLDPKNWDNAPWGLSGGIADRQNVGGFQGLSGRLVKEATERGLLHPRAALAVRGPTIADAIERSVDPYFRGLSGNLEACTALLRSLEIDPAVAPEALSKEGTERLAAELERRLQEQGARPEFVHMVRREAWTTEHPKFDAEDLSNLQNSVGRIGEPGLGISLALGDPTALHQAKAAEAQWRTGVMSGLRRLELEGPQRLGSIYWFESHESTLAGAQAGFAANYLLNPRHPVFGIAAESSTQMKVSSRATTWLVEQGLDLSVACREAARSVKGEGGGHRVAAGATIPAGSRQSFLEAAEKVVAGQIGGTAP
ncbi:MAG: DHH family phosphoesterase [Thermoplasmata archaeon]|nr:DHH family phosphoesterase [Thermoplasmata archaeon]